MFVATKFDGLIWSFYNSTILLSYCMLQKYFNPIVIGICSYFYYPCIQQMGWGTQSMIFFLIGSPRQTKLLLLLFQLSQKLCLILQLGEKGTIFGVAEKIF